MQKHWLIILKISFIIFAITPMKSFASGTYRSSSSAGNDYQMSKLIFHKKVTCDVCPFPGRGKNAQDAYALLQTLNQQSSLSIKEQRAAKNYLKRRFKLK